MAPRSSSGLPTMKPPTALIPFSRRRRTARGVSFSPRPSFGRISSAATFASSAFSMPMQTVSKPARALAAARRLGDVEAPVEVERTIPRPRRAARERQRVERQHLAGGVVAPAPGRAPREPRYRGQVAPADQYVGELPEGALALAAHDEVE